MNSCEKTLELLNEYIDGELGESEALFVRSHLEECEDCRKIYEELVAVDALFEGAKVEAPGELLEGVMSKVREEKTRKRARFLRVGTSVAAAAVVLTVFSSPLIMTIANKGASRSEAEDCVMAPAEEILDNKAEVLDRVEIQTAVGDYTYGEALEKSESEELTLFPNLEEGNEYVFVTKDGEKFTAVYKNETFESDGKKYECKFDGELMLADEEGVRAFRWNAAEARFEEAYE